MKKFAFILLIAHCSLLITNCLSQWVLQNTATTSIFNSIQFVNVNTGWAVGDNGLIIKTTNGGQDWLIQQSNLTANRLLTGIDMIDVNTGYIVGWYEAILKTTNGGNNWIVFREMPVAQGSSYEGLDFIDAQTGWICGSQHNTWKTNNGGLNWDSINVGGGGGYLRAIQFLNSQTGWVVGDVGFIRKTTNGGINWFFQFFATTSDFSYNSMHFININTGWVVGRYYSGVFGTTDGGNNWDTLVMIPNVRCLFFANQYTGWTGGMNGLLYKTTNGGHNWNLQSVPVAGVFIDINFVNDTIGWAANYNKIIHTTNGGAVGILPISNDIPYNYELFQNFPNPFNPSTAIKFTMPKDGSVSLKVYDVLGNEIKTLVEGYQKAGTYNIYFSGSEISSGVYYYRLTTETFTGVRKMVLVK